MPEIAPPEDEEPRLNRFCGCRQYTSKWRNTFRQIADITFGIAFMIVMFLIALQIHWILHQLLGDQFWNILFRLALAFSFGMLIGLNTRPLSEYKKRRANGRENETSGKAD